MGYHRKKFEKKKKSGGSRKQSQEVREMSRNDWLEYEKQVLRQRKRGDT